MTERIRLSRKKGWRLPEDALVVSRPHHLSNPIKVYEHCKGPQGDWGIVDAGRFERPMGHGWTRLGAHRAAVTIYEQLLDEAYPRGSTARALLAMSLRGKKLACWCPPELPCHVDVLIALADDPKYDELWLSMQATGEA